MAQRWSRQDLVAAAADLADEEGFAAVTPTALARRVGLTVPTLYSHVAGAAELRTQVALLALRELADELAQGLAGRAGADALAALGATFRSYARRHPGRWDAAELRLSPEAARASAGPRLATLSRQALHAYGLRDVDEVHAVRLVGSTVRGFVDLEAAGAFDHSPPSSADTWERITGSLDAQLRAWVLTPHEEST